MFYDRSQHSHTTHSRGCAVKTQRGSALRIGRLLPQTIDRDVRAEIMN